ncbi:hypothetical protein [Rhizobium sp. Rhizsp82]|uniref:COG3904 family protein n=1 Tax=Rhizobium sp. Rhizsp82 TaxID=3243057 RepID=UPI0039B55925
MLREGARLLVIKGEFEPADDPMKMVAEYTEFQPGFITFDSNGGSVVAAIKFGRAIRALNANTLQIRSTQCVSACALAFLGGVKRSAEPGAIGVHQAFFSDNAGLDNKAAVTTIQMLTGEVIGYLSDMGVSAKLLQLSLSIESSDMRYLTTAEMREWNIITEDRGPGTQAGSETTIATPASPTSAPQFKTEAAKPSPPSAPDRAIAFVRRYHAAWSAPNSVAMAFMQNAYGDEVMFYGKTVSQDAVMKDKSTFAQRWPERIYSVRPGSETALCGDKCNVTGIVEWFARSRERGKTSSGMAEFSLVWDPTTEKIETESSNVLATDKGARAPDRVIGQWQTENGKCRGSTDVATIERSCAWREEIGLLLDRFGWCYGHQNEYGYQMAWHLCDATSNRPR